MTSLRLAALPLLLATVALPYAASAAPAFGPYAARIAKVLKATPLIDGHNDWPEAMAGKAGDARWTMPLDRLDPSQYHTDITRLRAGQMGGQFWSVWVSADLPELQQVKDTVEQIELVHSLARRYPQDFTLATTAAEVRAAHKAGRIASMIGVEGGGQIDGSLAVLRAYHDLGAGYLTLTHSRTIAWADSATDNPQHDGLTPFGEAVVHELNRLGMLVDLAHVSEGVMMDALKVSKAPVIFSHSSARALCNTPRNVSDAILQQVAANGGVVMVNFAPQYVSEARRVWSAARSAEKQKNRAATRLGRPGCVTSTAIPGQEGGSSGRRGQRQQREHATLAGCSASYARSRHADARGMHGIQRAGIAPPGRAARPPRYNPVSAETVLKGPP